MFVILHALGMFVADLFKWRCRLQAENLFLRPQLNISLRRAPSRLRLRGRDRALLILMTLLLPDLLDIAHGGLRSSFSAHRGGSMYSIEMQRRSPNLDHCFDMINMQAQAILGIQYVCTRARDRSH